MQAIIVLTVLLTVASWTDAANKSSTRRSPDWTVAPKALEPDVQFWVDVYSKYDNDTAVLHDTEYMGVIYGSVDLHDLSCTKYSKQPHGGVEGGTHTASPGGGATLAPIVDDCKESVKTARQDRVDEAKDKIRRILLTLADHPPDGALTPEAKKIRATWRKWTTADIFREAAGEKRLRAQTGQKTRFEAGLTAAERYMPRFEAIFKAEGMPIELTRLVMVESMFNMNAFSRAGASGVWQFMPGTARKFGLKISKGVDDRSDPVLSAQAAARMLKYDYDIVGTWPLAINSYNAGRRHLERAIAALGTRDIVKIIRRYRVGSYGFASRNYYPEFLAACRVYDNRAQYFPALKHPQKNWQSK